MSNGPQPIMIKCLAPTAVPIFTKAVIMEAYAEFRDAC